MSSSAASHPDLDILHVLLSALVFDGLSRQLTFAFGGAFFGLQASLTILSRFDMFENSNRRTETSIYRLFCEEQYGRNDRREVVRSC